jgi:hypothetical protein
LIFGSADLTSVKAIRVDFHAGVHGEGIRESDNPGFDGGGNL